MEDIVQSAKCPSCGAPITLNAPECEHCNSALVWLTPTRFNELARVRPEIRIASKPTESNQKPETHHPRYTPIKQPVVLEPKGIKLRTSYGAISLSLLVFNVWWQVKVFGDTQQPGKSIIAALIVLIISILITMKTKLGDMDKMDMLYLNPDRPGTLVMLTVHGIVGTLSNACILLIIGWLVFWPLSALFGSTAALWIGGIAGLLFMLLFVGWARMDHNKRKGIKFS